MTATSSGCTLASVVGQITIPNAGNITPARSSRGSRSSRHSLIDYDYADPRRFRSYDEYSQGSGASHDEDCHSTSYVQRSDSPLSRLGSTAGSTTTTNCTEAIDTSRRRCDKSPVKQKGKVKAIFKTLTILS